MDRREKVLHGACKCGEPIIKTEHSATPTMWRNGDRYSYPDHPGNGYCIFRCRSCGEPVDKTFTLPN